MNKTTILNTECETAREAVRGDYVREVTARYIGPRRKSIVITDAHVAAYFMRKLLKDHVREHFLALYLSGSHRVVSHSLVSLGSANTAPIHPREIFQMALLVGACAIVVAHNHPSGDLNPSQADMDTTETLNKAGELLGIRLLDHIILSSDAYLSLNDLCRFTFE